MATQVVKPLRIAVILPERYGGGTFRGAMNTARMLALGAKAEGDPVEISFGHVDAPDLYSDSDFDVLRSLGVKIRPFRRETVEARKMAPVLNRLDTSRPKIDSPLYLSFNDGISNFEDCDFWVIVSDRMPYPIPPHRPYAIVVYDYIQRYIPEIFGVDKKSEENWRLFETYARITRHAQFVIANTNVARRDCINYTGSSADRVIRFPMEFDPLESREAPLVGDAPTKPYLLWTTNSTQHKNHLNMIAGLEKYFSTHPESPLEIHVTGVHTDLFSSVGVKDVNYSNAYPVRVRKAIADSPKLRQRLKVMGILSDHEYLQKLRRAHGMLHGALYDNGTYAILEGAWWGIPSISSEYPAIQESCANYELKPVLFNPHKPEELAKAVEQFVERYQELIELLPSRETLRRHTFSTVAPQYWRTFVNALESTRERHE